MSKRRIRAALRLWRARVRRVNLKLLRLSLRLVPSERRRVFGLTLVAGVVCGLAAVAFHLALRGTEHLLVDRAMAAGGHKWIVLTISVPTIGGLIGGALLQYVVPDARGSGIPQVKVAYVVKGGRMALVSATIGKFILGVIQIGTGASLGREGPTVQICAGLASML
ncbi:MAG TPA: chloride channel protein, partial [Pyrinomonadaceae bacterium]|nr:chloride channel protein [Pyrinomonadaceae bacterium]